MAATGADRFADQEFNELSDGQRQRAMVARGLAQEPRLLLLDEPTAFLDPPARIALLAVLASIAATRAVAVLVSTHDLELAVRLADTLWVANPDGRVISGGPEDLIHSGALIAPFVDDDTTFDPATLRFSATHPDLPTAVIDGDGPVRVLAAHALRRAGYQIVDAAQPADIRVTVQPGGAGADQQIRSCLRHGHDVAQQDNLDALARHARRLRSTKPPEHPPPANHRHERTA